jgi:hypothetical protein
MSSTSVPVPFREDMAKVVMDLQTKINVLEQNKSNPVIKILCLESFDGDKGQV